MITGVDLAYEDLERDRPDDLKSVPNDTPEDETVDLEPDEFLPWPAKELVAAWWDKNKSRFISGQRYLCGEPISKESCEEILKSGFQRQRASAAMELMFLTQRPFFLVSAPIWRQRLELEIMQN